MMIPELSWYFETGGKLIKIDWLSTNWEDLKIWEVIGHRYTNEELQLVD